MQKIYQTKPYGNNLHSFGIGEQVTNLTAEMIPVVLEVEQQLNV
jgi:hypothetical protein